MIWGPGDYLGPLGSRSTGARRAGQWRKLSQGREKQGVGAACRKHLLPMVQTFQAWCIAVEHGAADFGAVPEFEDDDRLVAAAGLRQYMAMFGDFAPEPAVAQSDRGPAVELVKAGGMIKCALQNGFAGGIDTGNPTEVPPRAGCDRLPPCRPAWCCWNCPATDGLHRWERWSLQGPARSYGRQGPAMWSCRPCGPALSTTNRAALLHGPRSRDQPCQGGGRSQPFRLPKHSRNAHLKTDWTAQVPPSPSRQQGLEHGRAGQSSRSTMVSPSGLQDVLRRSYIPRRPDMDTCYPGGKVR